MTVSRLRLAIDVDFGAPRPTAGRLGILAGSPWRWHLPMDATRTCVDLQSLAINCKPSRAHTHSRVTPAFN